MRVSRLAALTAVAALVAPGFGGAGRVAAAAAGGAGAQVRLSQRLTAATAPPTAAQCRQQLGHPCYSPQEIRRAYGIDAFLDHGDDGAGQSIVIIDSFGSPTITSDLETFDQGYGLPAPPSFKIYAPLGTVPFNPSNGDMVSWAVETTLDVEWAHAIAPAASINLLTSPVDETEGVQGMPQFLTLEKFAVAHHLGKIISQSWGATEQTLFTTAPGRAVINNFESFYRSLVGQGITVLASTGDTGTANPDVQGNIYPYPTVEYPASSPWVTAVGGTQLFASIHGNYQTEVAWNDGGIATGGGPSHFLPEPSWQRGLPMGAQQVLNGHRGIPDVSYNADEATAIVIYLSFQGAGYYTIAGTSEGAPQWAGIVADASQASGHPLGYLNPTLYRMGTSGALAGVLHDITIGHNGIDSIPGFRAHRGWDLTTGWGTPEDVFSLFAS